MMTTAVSLLWLLAGLARAGEPSPSMDLIMPGARPETDDSYLCSSFEVTNMTGGSETVYVTGFIPHALANKAHHMLLYTCMEPNHPPGVVYDCLHHSMCRSSQGIMFAWAKNAPPTTLPQGVSFTVDPGEKRYFVLQVHYAHPLAEPDHTGLSLHYQTESTKYRAGILLMLRGFLRIPANTAVIHGDVNCELPSSTPLHMFAYRTHAHGLSTVITGYIYNEEGHKYRQIAAGSPQWPQAFYPMKQINTVRPGEVLTARCTYNSTGVNHETNIGATAGDEMCNLYIMFFTEAKLSPGDSLGCQNEQAGHDITRGLPAESDKVPDKRLQLEAKASNNEVNAGPAEINYAQLFEDELSQSTSKKKVLDSPVSTVVQATLNFTMKGRQPKSLPQSSLSPDLSWPTPNTASKLGQLSGVSIDTYGNAVIFHRGDRTWTGQTFNNDNTYGLDRSVPIPQDTVLTVNSTGHIINSWGKNLFFLPHMITVDKQNNVWVTDVALHQVFKFPPYGGENSKDIQPLIALGTRFEPGSDDTHYCKPTAVAVMDDGNTFFVSDGYCNSRIIKYQVTLESVSGKHQVRKVLEWGKGAGPFTLKPADYNFNIPHGLALAEDKDELCVADRENGRVQCFNLDGTFIRTVKPAEFGSRIFSVAYTKARGGELHAVSGPEFSLNPFKRSPTGYQVSMETGQIVGAWNVPGGLQNPHDIAVSLDGNTLYVCELNPFKVWKLSTGAPSPAIPSPQSLPKAAPASSGVLPNLKMNSSVLLAAAVSVPLTILLAICLAVRRCRRRGRGVNIGKEGGARPRGKDWNVGDLLGRNKNGFKPLDTEERDGMLDDDSDSEVEEFSIPANHA